MSTASPTSKERSNLCSRRVFHKLERRYLSPEACSLACCLMDSHTVPHDVTENAIQQAVLLGTMSGTAIDVQTFEALLEAISLNPSFTIPFSGMTSLKPSCYWVC